MKRLTKEDILEGTRRRDNIFVKEYGREVVIRPLSDEEITIILSKTSISIAGENPPPPPATGNSIDLEKNFEALRLVCLYGDGGAKADIRRGRKDEIWSTRIHRFLYSTNKWS